MDNMRAERAGVDDNCGLPLDAGWGSKGEDAWGASTGDVDADQPANAEGHRGRG